MIAYKTKSEMRRNSHLHWQSLLIHVGANAIHWTPPPVIDWILKTALGATWNQFSKITADYAPNYKIFDIGFKK